MIIAGTGRHEEMSTRGSKLDLGHTRSLDLDSHLAREKASKVGLRMSTRLWTLHPSLGVCRKAGVGPAQREERAVLPTTAPTQETEEAGPIVLI